MATKIFSFPVRGRRWCFCAIVPDVPAGKYSSVVTLSQLWERLQSLPQFTDRAELMESFASTKVYHLIPSHLLFALEILAIELNRHGKWLGCWVDRITWVLAAWLIPCDLCRRYMQNGME